MAKMGLWSYCSSSLGQDTQKFWATGFVIDFVARMTFFGFSLNCVGSPLFGREAGNSTRCWWARWEKWGVPCKWDKEAPGRHLAGSQLLRLVLLAVFGLTSMATSK